MENLITEQQAAEFLGIKKRKLMQLRRDSKIKGFLRFGRKTIMYRIEELENFINGEI